MVRALFVALILSWCSEIITPKAINSFAGPFIVLMKEVSDCPDEFIGENLIRTKGIITHKIIRARAPSEPVFNGVFYVLSPIDDTLTAVVKMSSWNPVSGWVPNYIHVNLPKTCSILFERARAVIGSLLKYCKEKPPLTCPLQKKNYTIQDMPTAYRLKAIPGFYYGKWKVFVQLYQKDKVTACVMVRTDTVPPESVRGQSIQDL